MDFAKKKPVCKYGKGCYRKNPEHVNEYHHPGAAGDAQEDAKSEEKPKTTFVPKKPLRQTTLAFTRVGMDKNKAHSPLLNNSSGVREDKPIFGKVAKETTDKVKSSDEKSPIARKDKPIFGRISKEKDNGVNLKSPTTKKRSSDEMEKNEIKRQKGDKRGQKMDISSSDSSDNEGVADVSSNSWVFEKNETKEILASDSEEEQIENVECNTPAEIIKHLFLVDMPADFYSFYEFCESLGGKDPRRALSEFGLRLVGAFDVLSGDMKPNSVSQVKALCHWRFYMDPPEMQTVLLAEEEGVHYGYWRDEPDTKEPFVAKNAIPDCKFMSAGANLFHVAVDHMEGYIRSCNPFEKVKAGKVLSALKQWAEEKDFDLADTPAMLNRKKKVVAATFHCLGIVVPVQPKTDIGYRPLLETNANLRKMCLSVINAKTEEGRNAKLEGIDRLINCANIANDECDFGNSLELGIDLFCMGSKIFHTDVQRLLTTAYSLLNRPENAKIIKAHLKNRRATMDLSVL